MISKDFEYKIFWYLARSCSTAGLNRDAIDFYEEAYKRCNLPNKYGILMTYLYTMVAANTSPARMLQGLQKVDEMLPDGKLEPDEMLTLSCGSCTDFRSGWMESTGMKETDYLITDKFMDEPGYSYITEKPLYVSTCF